MTIDTTDDFSFFVDPVLSNALRLKLKGIVIDKHAQGKVCTDARYVYGAVLCT